MGIRNLGQLVKSAGVLRDLEFREQNLVIDGSNLICHLYFESGLDQIHGGEYGAFEALVSQFIEALRTCAIRPYVVFDGCADFSDQRKDTERQRGEQRVQKAHKAAESGKNMGVLPTLIYEVFRQTLHRLEVPVARGYTEADRQAAALAQDWGCPVLSNDSDFYIFPMKGGVLPTAHFRWKEVEKRGAQSFIRCKRFLSYSFCEAVHIPPHMLPVFAVLAGNDYTKAMVMSGNMRPGQQQRAPHTNLQDLISWISGFKDAEPQAVFEAVLKHLSVEERQQKIKTLQEAADNYSLPPSSLGGFFHQDTLPLLPPQMEMVPDWMRRPVTEARFTSDFLDVLTNHRVGLSVVVDHKDKPSANKVSLPLRQVIYGLLLGEDGAVEERDRDGLHVTFNSVTPVSTQLSLQSLPQTERVQQRQVLLEALGLTGQSFSLPSHLSHLELPLAATCFWFKQAQPPLDLLKALLIGWFKEDTLRHNADSRVSLDLDWCHWLNLWQSCLRDSFNLNQLLGAPLQEPTMARLYNGTLVHDLLHKMKTGRLDKSLQSYIDNDKDFSDLLFIAVNRQTGRPDLATAAASETVAPSSPQTPASVQSERETGSQVTKRLKTSLSRNTNEPK